MNKPNITEGKWKFEFNENTGGYQVVSGIIIAKKIKLLDAKAISAVPEMIDLLKEVRQSYQGVGDFEGSGENLMKLIPEIDKCLEKAGCKL